MSCIYVSSCRPAYNFNASFSLLTAPQKASKLTTFSSTYLGPRLPNISLSVRAGVYRRKHSTIVCLFGSKGKASDDNEGSPRKDFEKGMENLKKEPDIEDLLRQQMEREEYYEDGDDGGDGPGGGGDGPGDGGEDDYDDYDDLKGFLDDLGQGIMAAMAFVFLYIYIINREEINVFTKDIVRYIFTRKKSIRLRRLMDQLSMFFESLTEKEEYDDPDWLEKAIINSTTWYDGPAKYRRIFGRSRSSSYY